MPRISDEARARNEAAVRAAMDRLLRGEVPAGGRCDLKTLDDQAGVSRTGFYPKGERSGPYQHLAEEFERRLTKLRAAGRIPDPREAQITWLKEHTEHQRGRIADLEAHVADLTGWRSPGSPPSMRRSSGSGRPAHTTTSPRCHLGPV